MWWGTKSSLKFAHGVVRNPKIVINPETVENRYFSLYSELSYNFVAMRQVFHVLCANIKLWAPVYLTLLLSLRFHYDKGSTRAT